MKTIETNETIAIMNDNSSSNLCLDEQEFFYKVLLCSLCLRVTVDIEDCIVIRCPLTSMTVLYCHRKTFESSGGHGSTHNQTFFGDLLKISLGDHDCAKKVGYLPENFKGLSPFAPWIRS